MFTLEQYRAKAREYGDLVGPGVRGRSQRRIAVQTRIFLQCQFARHVAWIVMECSRLLFTRLFLIWSLVVAHGKLLVVCGR